MRRCGDEEGGDRNGDRSCDASLDGDGHGDGDRNGQRKGSRGGNGDSGRDRAHSRLVVPLRPLAAVLGLVLLLILSSPPCAAITLQEAYQAAGPANGYDRWVELETGVVYTGGLLVGPVLDPILHEIAGEPGVDVRIVGNGAVLDLDGRYLCISYADARLDISDCVIVEGAIRFRGIDTADTTAIPRGSVRNVTFYRPNDYAVRLYGAGTGVLLERNLVVDVLDTGWDFQYITGIAMDWLPTGTAYSLSVQTGHYGVPEVRDNWSWHSDPQRNADPLTHYSLLCEYG